MQEIDRFPIVERSTSELPMLNDPAFSTRINGSLEKLLLNQGIPMQTKQVDQEKPHDAQRPNTQPNNERDKDSRLAPSDGEAKQEEPSRTPKILSETIEKPSVASVQEQNATNQDPDSMDVDG